MLYLLCFSDAGPGTGPHPVSEEELRAAFTGWDVSVDPDRILTRFEPQGVPAWLARIERTYGADDPVVSHVSPRAT